jgi:protein-tyrosine-phosphatase
MLYDLDRLRELHFIRLADQRMQPILTTTKTKRAICSEPRYRILFLSTGNAVRSIFAEYVIRMVAKDRFEAYSAGTDPQPAVNPYVLRVLQQAYGIDASAARPKSWDLFEDTRFEFFVTVWDRPKEDCPRWVGQEFVGHWFLPDPASFDGNDQETYQHFWRVSQQLHRRIEQLCNLPLAKLDALRLDHAMKAIGEGRRF